MDSLHTADYQFRVLRFRRLEQSSPYLHAGSTILDWTSEFATTIDESAWFLLLFMFELETNVVDDKYWKGWLVQDPMVSDMAGLSLERDLAWVDLIEVVVWLQILLAIEIVVRLQSRSITGGALLSTGNAFKVFVYLTLIAFGIYWASLSHWLYFWDELVWIGGFAAIEVNVSQWRDELLEEKDELLSEDDSAIIRT